VALEITGKAQKKFEIHRRVTAENVSRDNYIWRSRQWASGTGFRRARRVRIQNASNCRAFGMDSLPERKYSTMEESAWKNMHAPLPYGVILCRKGVIEKWPTPGPKRIFRSMWKPAGWQATKLSYAARFTTPTSRILPC